MALFQCGTARLMLGPAQQPVNPAGTILYYKVGDLQRAHAALSAKGIEFLQQPPMVAKMPDHDL